MAQAGCRGAKAGADARFLREAPETEPVHEGPLRFTGRVPARSDMLRSGLDESMGSLHVGHLGRVIPAELLTQPWGQGISDAK